VSRLVVVSKAWVERVETEAGIEMADLVEAFGALAGLGAFLVAIGLGLALIA
jgi:hypothetical protein